MRPRLLVLCSLVVAFFLLPTTALACECGPGTPDRPWYAAPFIFIGTVTAIEHPPEPPNTRGEITVNSIFTSFVSIRVDQQFRGASRTELRLTQQFGKCDYGFEKGRSYLIFDRTGDGASVGTCNAPIPLADASEDLRFVESVAANRSQAILRGTISERRTSGEVMVVMDGGGKEKQFRRAYLKDSYSIAVPPGKYRVWLEQGGQQVSKPETVELRNGDALRQNLSLDH